MKAAQIEPTRECTEMRLLTAVKVLQYNASKFVSHFFQSPVSNRTTDNLDFISIGCLNTGPARVPRAGSSASPSPSSLGTPRQAAGCGHDGKS